MKLPACPNCPSTDIKYNTLTQEYFCRRCNTWPRGVDPQEVAEYKWRLFANREQEAMK
jgi:hypothetical protein